MMSSKRSLRTAAAALLCLAMTALGVVMLAPTASAAAQLTVSKTDGLKDGVQITVSGSGFSPKMTQIAVGQCHAPVSGPTDCNLAGGAKFVNADADGNIAEMTLTIAAKFGDFDCTAGGCVIAAQILPGAGNVAANSAEVAITMAGGGAADDGGDDGGGGGTPTDTGGTTPTDTGGTTPTSTGGTTPTGTGGTTTGTSASGLPNTGSADGLTVLAMWGGVLLLFGGAVMLLAGPRPAVSRRLLP